MGKMSVVGDFACQPGRAEEMERVLRAMVAAAADEPGVEVYSYHRGEGDTFWFFAVMRDEESMRSHGQSAAMRAAMAEFGPLVAQPPRMRTTTPVAAIGLPQ
jgi:quinol monooxygenase YgiN